MRVFWSKKIKCRGVGTIVGVYGTIFVEWIWWISPFLGAWSLGQMTNSFRQRNRIRHTLSQEPAEIHRRLHIQRYSLSKTCYPYHFRNPISPAFVVAPMIGCVVWYALFFNRWVLKVKGEDSVRAWDEEFRFCDEDECCLSLCVTSGLIRRCRRRRVKDAIFWSMPCYHRPSIPSRFRISFVVYRKFFFLLATVLALPFLFTSSLPVPPRTLLFLCASVHFQNGELVEDSITRVGSPFDFDSFHFSCGLGFESIG